MSVLAVSHGLLDQPGTVAFLVIFGMGVMLFFVFRSMSKHLRKINMAARAEAEAAARAQGAGGDEAAEAGTGPRSVPGSAAIQPQGVDEQRDAGRR